MADDGAGDGPTLFEALPDPVLAYVKADPPVRDTGSNGTDATAVVRAVNPAFEATFGLDAEEVDGRALDDVALDDVTVADSDAEDRNGTADDSGGLDTGPPTTVGALFDAVRSDDAPLVDVRRGTSPETRHYRVRPVTAGAESDGGYLLFGDVTGAERERRELVSSVDRLERIARVASHDLRNPLEVAEIRLAAARDTGDAVHFEKVAGALDRIESIVGDVLVAGDGVEPIEVVKLGDIARAAWDTVETGDATLVVAEGVPAVRGDADGLRQLFENLFRNCVEHGGPAVTVSVEPSDDGFVVADDGPGVPPDARGRIFEAGYSTAAENNGLGLSIVKRLAREHGWRVSLTAAEADTGARFRFSGVDPVEDG